MSSRQGKEGDLIHLFKSKCLIKSKHIFERELSNCWRRRCPRLRWWRSCSRPPAAPLAYLGWPPLSRWEGRPSRILGKKILTTAAGDQIRCLTIYLDTCVRMNEVGAGAGEFWMTSMKKTDFVQRHESIGKGSFIPTLPLTLEGLDNAFEWIWMRMERLPCQYCRYCLNSRFCRHHFWKGKWETCCPQHRSTFFIKYLHCHVFLWRTPRKIYLLLYSKDEWQRKV